MSYNKEEIKITKKEKNDSESLIKNIIYFSYKNIDYMYYKTTINKYKDYEINIYILKDEWKGKPIYSEYGSENDDCELLIERNYSQIDDDFCNELTNLQLISENYKIGQEKFYDKLDYYYDYFRNEKNAPIIQTNRPKENYEHFFYDSRLKYFFKINGKSYWIFRLIHLLDFFIVHNIDGSYIKIDFDRKQDLDDSQIDDVYSTEIRTRTKNLDIDEYYNIINVMNSYFDKNFIKNNLQLIKVEGDEYEYVFSETKN
jgi:hypothetical protein